jgi:hypothetical protein
MKTIFYILFLTILLGCSKSEPDFSIPFTDQSVFKNAKYIQVPLYAYKDNSNGKTYTFQGTSNDLISVSNPQDRSFIHIIPYNYYDTISNHPVFAWEKTGSKNVMVAIFNERISIDNEKQQIKNINAIVWAWNTGMSTGQEGAISYNNGCDVIDGVIQYNMSPTPLENSSDYILAIWAWDEYAEQIAYSSREIPFVVEK